MRADSVPFEVFLRVDMDLSVVGVQEALSEWFTRYKSYPSVLWCSPEDIGYAESVISASPEHSLIRRLAPIPHPEYSGGWWSVGTYLEKGFGCEGA